MFFYDNKVLNSKLAPNWFSKSYRDNVRSGDWPFSHYKGPVKLIKRVKIAHSFLQSVLNQFHVIILSLNM